MPEQERQFDVIEGGLVSLLQARLLALVDVQGAYQNWLSAIDEAREMREDDGEDWRAIFSDAVYAKLKAESEAIDRRFERIAARYRKAKAIAKKEKPPTRIRSAPAISA